MILDFSLRLSVCVSRGFQGGGFFPLQDVWDILERHVSTMLCCEDHSRRFSQVPSSPFLNMSYFTSEDKTPARRKLERKRYGIWLHEKMIYINVGHNSAHHRSDKWRKDTKYKEATLILILLHWIKSWALA